MRRLILIIFFLISGYQAFSFEGSTPPIISTIFLVLMALPMLLGLYSKHGSKAILSWLLLGLFAVLFEAFAINTGWPYGFFSYGEDLGLRIFGTVPLAIALAWPLIIYSAFLLTERFKTLKLSAIITLLIVVLIDMAIDPAATALSFWNWETTTGFYGVPWVNFLGWFFSGFVGIALVKGVLGEFRSQKTMHWSIVMFFAFFTGVNIAASLYIPAILSSLILLKSHILWKKT